MKGSSGFNDIPKERNEIKARIIIFLIALTVGLAIGGLLIVTFMPTNPLGQYINTRTCDFISMGGFQSAVCTDGTVWSVSPFQE